MAEGRKRPLSVKAVAEEAAAMLARTLPKTVELELALQEGLPPVAADAQQMEQVFINLATNAADAMAGAGTITVSASRPHDADRCRLCGERLPPRHVLISCRDTGAGMTPEVRAKIFEPFFTTKEVGKGTGLGLSSVYGIVTGHGGHICCESEVGKGTEFLIHLPAADEEPSQSPGRERAAGGVPEGAGTLLVVDDEPAVRDVAGNMLSLGGYEVLPAASGEEALALYQEHQHEIALVLLDLGMPGMGGKRCLAEIRRLDPDAKVLIASGYLQYGLTDELESLGATGMVSKPYRRSELLQAVRETMG
jgi:CheY-like chemotaxis protein